MDRTVLFFFLAAVYAVLSNGTKVIPKRYVHSANGGKKDMKPHCPSHKQWYAGVN